MEVESDFRDLPVLFNRHRVDYMIVGGYALVIDRCLIYSKRLFGQVLNRRLIQL